MARFRYRGHLLSIRTDTLDGHPAYYFSATDVTGRLVRYGWHGGPYAAACRAAKGEVDKLIDGEPAATSTEGKN